MAAENETGRAPARVAPIRAARRSFAARRRPGAARRRLSEAGVASLALHLLILAGAILAGLRWPARSPAPQREVRVALVLKEQKGAGRTQAPAHPPPPPPATAARPPLPPRPRPPVAAPSVPVAVPAAEAPPAHRMPPPQTVPPAPPRAAATAAPPPTPRPVAPVRPTPAPAPPAPPARSGFQFNLGGTNSETNAIVRGSAIVPAKPDARFRNREPIYPDAAARRGEQGTVVLLIHVAPDGQAREVEILQSSGFPLLDRAAQQAVERWHFLPAMRDGQAVAASMPLRVVFSLQ